MSDVFTLGESEIVNNPITRRDYQVGLYYGELGLDYQFTEKHALGFLFSAQYRDWQMDSDANNNRTTDGVLLNIMNNNTERNQFFRTLSNINYKFQITPDRVFSLDYDYIRFKRENPTDYSIRTTRNDQSVEERFSKSDSKTPLNIHVLAANYTDKLAKSLQLETGVKWTTSVFENDLIFEDFTNDTFIPNPLFTDDFSMDENIYAGYLSLDWNINEKLQFKGGARYEQYKINLQSLKNGILLNRENGRIYPNIFFRYMVTDDMDLNLSYSERVERPGFLILAPAFYFYDQFTLFTGNPIIIPTISKRIKFDLRYKKLTVNVLYTDYENPTFNLQPDIDEELGLYKIRPLQAEEGNTISLSSSMPIKITNKWNSRINANFNRIQQQPIIEGFTLKNINFNYNLLVVNSYQFGANLEAELSSQYYSRLQYSAAEIDPRWGIDFGLRKKFKGGQSLAFNVTDVFNTMSQYKVGFDAAAAEIRYKAFYDLEGPIFRISFSTPFGNKNLKRMAKRASMSNEEQERLN